MPRHIRNIIIAVFLLLLAVAVGINSYIHSQFEKNIDQTLSSVKGFITIKYNELSTSVFSGKVKLENVRLSTPFLPEEFILGDITFETPGFSYMLSHAGNINKDELPEHLGFTLENFYFDLHGETAGMLDMLVKRMQPLYASERKICAGKAVFSPADYKEMGYSRLSSNIYFSYRFNKDNKLLHIDLTANTQNMVEIKISARFTDVQSVSAAKKTMPKLAKLNLTYKDKTYIPRMLKYCSALDEIKKEEFINAEVTQSDEYFYMLLGRAPGKGLREAYKDFLSKPDLVTLSMTPSKNFNPKVLSSLTNEELIKNLNVRLKINGLPINDLSYTTASVAFSEKFEQQLSSNLNLESLLRGDPIKAAKAVEKPKPIIKKPAAYYPIAVTDISQYVGGFVQVTTKTGKERNGQLIRMDNINLYVEKKVSGGQFTMTVPRDKIESVKAFFSKALIEKTSSNKNNK